MVAYLLRKTLFGVLTIFVASTIVFVLVDGLQSGSLLAGASLRARYAQWVAGMARGDFGATSMPYDSANEVIAVHAWPTILLVGSSLALTVLLAVPLGVYSAARRGGAVDSAGRAFFFAAYSVPGFWLGAMLQLVLGIYLARWAGARVLPIAGMGGIEDGGGGAADLLWHLLLPAVALSAAGIAEFARFQRGAMIEALASDYVRTARAKGLNNRTVHHKHALRNALLPTVTLLALSMGAFSGGAVIIEVVFAWPGLGYLLLDSLAYGDYGVVRALLMINVVFVVFFNLVADLAYALLDPRIGYD